jgi:hypothetical protein
MVLPHFARAVLITCALAGPVLADPRPEPFPSCAAPLWPSSAVAGSPPSVAAWTRTELPHEWTLQPCVGWGLQQFTAFAAVVGTFQAAGMDAVLSRIGAISTYKGMHYWSVTDNRLEPLIKSAFAVEGSPPNNMRSDYTPAEIQVGRDLFFTEQDNRSSDPVLYRMKVIERSPDRIVVDIANANKVRRFLLTLFEPGDLHTALFISVTPDGIWTCYALSGFRPTTLTGLLDNHKSQVNRLLALYGHIAELDTGGLPWAK